MSETDLAALTRLIRHRRTIKPAAMDTTRPVPRPLLEQLLENATWAPTHGMTEPWHFQVFLGSARQVLADRLQQLYTEIVPHDQFRDDKFAKLGNNPLLAPVVLLVAMQRQAIEKIPEIEEIEAVACAVQNLHLSAAAAGLGGFWSSPPLLYDDRTPGRFGLPENARCLGLFYLGYPKEGEPWPESQRLPVGEKVRFIEDP